MFEVTLFFFIESNIEVRAQWDTLERNKKLMTSSAIEEKECIINITFTPAISVLECALLI